ncbi:hypothetical protein [Arenimonas alkanexedens]
MIRATLLALTGLMMTAWTAAASAQANWPVLASTENFIVVCMPKVPGCEAGAAAGDQVALKARAATVAAESERIKKWFAGLAYPEIQLKKQNGKMLLMVGSQEECGAGSTACHIDSMVICGTLVSCRVIVLPHENLLEGTVEKGTLAHEMFHALNRTAAWFSPETKWLDEALASTVGMAWARKRGEPSEVGFALSLDRPFHAGFEGGYEKPEYFLLLGERLGSAEKVRYLSDFFQLRNDGQNGMSFLYDKAGSAPFDKLYPDFVARHNSMARDFSASSNGEMTQGDFYDAFEKKRVRIADPSIDDFEDFGLSVQPFASAPVHFTEINTSRNPGEEAKDLLMVARFQLRDARRPQDLALVFEDTVARDGEYAYLFSGHDPIDGGFVRVTNAASTFEDTAPQDFTLRFQHQAVEFQLPNCIMVGNSAPIELKGSLSGAENWSIRTSAGRVDDLVFHAPGTPGEVKVTLEIRTHVTRKRSERSVATPDVVKIDLGIITVAANACDIRMEFVGESLAATFSSREDYTEYDAPEGNRIYIGNARIAAYFPDEGGWVQFPPEAGQVLEGQMRMMFGAPSMMGTPPWAQPEPNMMRRMPQVFTAWYDWNGLTDHLFPQQKKSSLGTGVPCPTSGTGCVRLTFEGQGQGQGLGSATYDQQRRLVELEGEGKVVRFTYGQTNMQLPPGWQRTK